LWFICAQAPSFQNFGAKLVLLEPSKPPPWWSPVCFGLPVPLGVLFVLDPPRFFFFLPGCCFFLCPFFLCPLCPILIFFLDVVPPRPPRKVSLFAFLKGPVSLFLGWGFSFWPTCGQVFSRGFFFFKFGPLVQPRSNQARESPCVFCLNQSSPFSGEPPPPNFCRGYTDCFSVVPLVTQPFFFAEPLSFFPGSFFVFFHNSFVSSSFKCFSDPNFFGFNRVGARCPSPPVSPYNPPPLFFDLSPLP